MLLTFLVLNILWGRGPFQTRARQPAGNGTKRAEFHLRVSLLWDFLEDNLPQWVLPPKFDTKGT